MKRSQIIKKLNVPTSLEKFAGEISLREFVRRTDWEFLKGEMHALYSSIIFSTVI